MDDERSCDGSAFQTAGAATWKLRRPSCVILLPCRGVLNRADARRGLGGTQHPYWEFPAPVLRQAHSTPTRSAPLLSSTLCELWVLWVHSFVEHTDMEIVHGCNCNSAVVETPTTWKLLNLLSSDVTASYILRPLYRRSVIHDEHLR